jgi:hypothetical protein
MARGRQAKSFGEVKVSFCHARNRFQLPEGLQLLESPDGSVALIRPNGEGGFEVVMGPMACSTLCDGLDIACELARLGNVSFLPQS